MLFKFLKISLSSEYHININIGDQKEVHYNVKCSSPTSSVLFITWYKCP